MEIENVYSKGFGKEVRHYTMVNHFFLEFNGDPNIIYIYAGPQDGAFMHTPPQTIADYILSQNPNDDTKIIFDNLYEGWLSPIPKIHTIVKLTGLKASQFYYCFMAMDAVERYEELRSKFGWNDPIHIYVANIWEAHMTTNLSAYGNREYKVGEREKKFLCFNRIIREHRFALAGAFLDEGLTDQAFYSFFPNNSYYREASWESCADQIKNWNIHNKAVRGITDNLACLPLKLNAEPFENPNYIKQDDGYYFDNSYFSLVTETFFKPISAIHSFIEFEDLNAIFFSEKIFKPIAMKHPFVLACRPGSLDALRSIGYKTFHPWINETYDTIKDDSERISAIFREVKRLCKLSVEEWKEIQEAVIPILEHNHKVLVNRRNTGFKLTPFCLTRY